MFEKSVEYEMKCIFVISFARNAVPIIWLQGNDFVIAFLHYSTSFGDYFIWWSMLRYKYYVFTFGLLILCSITFRYYPNYYLVDCRTGLNPSELRVVPLAKCKADCVLFYK